MARGLLQRLADRAGGKPDSLQAQAVLEHLRQLLNTRQGSSALDPLYGIPDFTDLLHSFPDGLFVLQRALAETITRYEPRLRAVSVRPVRVLRDTLVLQFEVTGQLASGQPLRFETQVFRAGHVRVA
jgi:type VI secretion system protein